MMDLPLNDIEPMIMHIDLNSCYAIIEQQANRLIRHKAVGVAAYDSPGGFIIASSYEAKRQGIKLMRVKDAKQIDRNIIILTPDPEKYFDAHRRFRAILERYSAKVVPKSIDEFQIDFTSMRGIKSGKDLVRIGDQIKQDIKHELGEYVTVNIGIAPNRFFAKVAAGLDKPDGLDIIYSKDIPAILGQLDLVDLPGINHRYQARLHFADIFSPLDFIEAPMFKLKQQVFKSINGYYWYLRLRGYEIDSQIFGTKSFGNDYALGNKTTNRDELSRLLMKLSEKTGRRMRTHGYQAQGVFLGMGFEDRSWFGKSQRSKNPLYSTQDIYRSVMRIFHGAHIPARVIHLNISVYSFVTVSPMQLGLFDDTRLDTRSLAFASDKINDRYGEYTLVPATMANMNDLIIKRVPFGSVRDI